MESNLTVKAPTIHRARLAWSLYINYFIHGFGLIILAQNMTSLGAAWNSPLKIVSFVISGVGIGRLLSYLINGFLADLSSRKAFVLLGMSAYLAFAIGIPFSHNIYVAYFFAILAGIANSALDAGTYTTFVELNGGNGAATILIKAFMSAGEFVLPLLIAQLTANGLWFGWSFMTMAALVVINFVLILPLSFPLPNQSPAQEGSGEKKVKPNWVTTIALVLYGYTSMAVMIWFTQWISLFAADSLHFSDGQAHFLLSLYSLGSISGVMLIFALLKRNVKETHLLISMNVIAVLALLGVLVGTSTVMVQVASFVFGLSAAGGIMQVGLTLFMRFFPHHRGMVTREYYFFGSIASFTVPLITGVLSTTSMRAAMTGDLVVGLIGSALMLVVLISERGRHHG